MSLSVGEDRRGRLAPFSVRNDAPTGTFVERKITHCVAIFQLSNRHLTPYQKSHALRKKKKLKKPNIPHPLPSLFEQGTLPGSTQGRSGGAPPPPSFERSLPWEVTQATVKAAALAEGGEARQKIL